MPYRAVTVQTDDGRAETYQVRISDAAVAEWLMERSRLQRCGYPDRPPDVDTPTLRVWLARPGEERLLYFRNGPTGVRSAADSSFPVYTASWHQGDMLGAKVIVTGFFDGSFLSRVIVDGTTGEPTIDKARLHGTDEDPTAIWADVETIVAFIDRSHPHWDAGDPLVTDYADFVALDAELVAAEADAHAAGFLGAKTLDG